MTRKNNYLQQLQQRRQGTTSPEPTASTKAPSEMTSEELEAESRRLEAELRTAREQSVDLGRQELAARSSNLGDVLRAKSRRRPWK